MTESTDNEEWRVSPIKNVGENYLLPVLFYIENIRKMSTKNLKSKTSEKPLENLWFLVVEHIRNMSTSARFSKTFWKPPANIAPSLVVPLDTYILPRNKLRLKMRPDDSQEICWCNRLSLMWCSQHQAQIWDGCDLNVVLMSFEMNLGRIHWMRQGGSANGDS